MSPRVCLVLFLLAACRGAFAAEFKFDDHTLTVPDGYVVERAAAPPLVDRPITMAFDEAGALYVADSSGSNEKPEAQWKNPTHRIVRLWIATATACSMRSTVFADKLAFPEGTMWLDGSLYVAVPPQIWKFTDTNADGVADKREVWFDGKTLTGCANDLHGPYAGPDGFIYWCKGAFAEQRHTLADGRQFRDARRARFSRAARWQRAGCSDDGRHGQSRGRGLQRRGRDVCQRHVFRPAGRRQTRRHPARGAWRRVGKAARRASTGIRAPAT